MRRPGDPIQHILHVLIILSGGGGGRGVVTMRSIGEGHGDGAHLAEVTDLVDDAHLAAALHLLAVAQARVAVEFRRREPRVDGGLVLGLLHRHLGPLQVDQRALELGHALVQAHGRHAPRHFLQALDERHRLGAALRRLRQRQPGQPRQPSPLRLRLRLRRRGRQGLDAQLRVLGVLLARLVDDGGDRGRRGAPERDRDDREDGDEDTEGCCHVDAIRASDGGDGGGGVTGNAIEVVVS
uniref:Uncharacterized protein n=1 Tax=Zea mays TaxID=4577 RepID=A0A804M6U4_MAIZE